MLNSLAVSLEQARTAVLESDIETLRQETARQQEICVGLRRLPAPILPWPSLPAAQRTVELKEKIRQVETQVAQLNRVYGALLRHARRTVDIFCRVLTSAALTYTPPRKTARSICELGS